MSQVKNQSFKNAFIDHIECLLISCTNKNSKVKEDFWFVDKSLELYYWPCWWQKLMVKVLLLETLDEEIAQITQFYPQANRPFAMNPWHWHLVPNLTICSSLFCFRVGYRWFLQENFSLTTTIHMGCSLIPRTYSVGTKNVSIFVQNQKPNQWIRTIIVISI